jgi:mannose-1-phosphate guanylyltransferase
MRTFHSTHGFPITLGVFRAAHPERCGIAELDQNGTVTSFVEKPTKPKSNLAAAGIYLADQGIFDVFPDPRSFAGSVLDLGFDIFPKMVGKMKVFEIDELVDIGTPEAYEKAQQVWQKRLDEQT